MNYPTLAAIGLRLLASNLIIIGALGLMRIFVLFGLVIVEGGSTGAGAWLFRMADGGSDLLVYGIPGIVIWWKSVALGQLISKGLNQS
jgi:hypothetical protein